MDEHRASLPLVVGLEEEAARESSLTGGKGANLAKLIAGGFPVPGGFCVTTGVCREFLGDPEVKRQVEVLEQTEPPESGRSKEIAAKIRSLIEEKKLPGTVTGSLEERLEHGETYAVRSSATAEDLPAASFAGQHDTILGVTGSRETAAAVVKCMAGLFTDRAVAYRKARGIAHTAVLMAVVVQKMVKADYSGVLFTADPATGKRTVASIDASPGLGEELVSGKITAVNIKIDRQREEIIARSSDSDRLLSDEQVRELSFMGARAESFFGAPQDLEWSFAGDQLWILQARPITTLFPLPEPPPQDEGLHVYYSWNHRQGMTAVMPPLVVDYWLRTMDSLFNLLGVRPPGGSLGKAAGGLIYLDVTAFLRSRRMAPKIIAGLHDFDRQAVPVLEAIIERWREELARMPLIKGVSLAQTIPSGFKLAFFALKSVGTVIKSLCSRAYTRAPQQSRELAGKIVREMIAKIHAGETVRERLQVLFAEKPDFLWGLLKPTLLLWNIYFYRTLLKKLCPETEQAFEPLERGLRENVTTAMMLELGDLADLARDYPQVEGTLAGGGDLEAIRPVEGGGEFVESFENFLHRYGFRASGEIEFSRPRYEEDPSALLAAIRSTLGRGTRGEHRRHLAELEAGAEETIRRLEKAAAGRFMGFLRRRLVRPFALRYRSYLSVRELPKFALSRLLAETRRQVLDAGSRLESEGTLARAGDVWFFKFGELMEALEEPRKPLAVDMQQRRAEHEWYKRLKAPRVILSDGEVPPAEAASREGESYVGIPTAGGEAEGTVRVVFDPESAALKAGEILVAPHTDPGWTPLFLNAGGLITDVGGAMTHGSLVAREYGIPSVVLAEATSLLENGQEVHVDGNRGLVTVTKPREDGRLDHE